jgi:hypothetical protein
LTRYMAVKKASSQKFNGMDAYAIRVNPTSTMWRCLRSAEPFCWCACDQETWCEMPICWKRELSFWYSPPICLHCYDLAIKKSFKKVLKIMETLKNF